MEMNKKSKHLRGIFVKYLSIFCIGTLLLLLILGVSYGMLLSNGEILSSNYNEKRIQEIQDTMIEQRKITPDLINGEYSYALFTTNGEIISGNLKESTAKKAYKLLEENEVVEDFFYYYVKVSIEDKVCIFRYSISSEFKSPLLRKFLPTPGILTVILFVVFFILEVIILALLFSKQIVHKMRCLHEVTEKIKNQDLDFVVDESGIYEIDNVLQSMIKMRNALKKSLEEQWQLEEMRNEQMSSLAHDIKSPVTVIRGNTELLFETELTNEQKEYLNFIIQSSSQIQEYIKTLIEISRDEMKSNLKTEKINAEEFIEEIHDSISALTGIKKLQLEFNKGKLPKDFYGNSSLLKRAIINVVSNAVEHSKENEKVIFNCNSDQKNIIITIIDYGIGFSKEDLVKGMQKFYMGDSSRSNKTHYGMGLYIAHTIAIKHNGNLILRNSKTTNGAEVEIQIPL